MSLTERRKSGPGRRIGLRVFATAIGAIVAFVFGTSASRSAVTSADLQQAIVTPVEGARIATESRWTGEDGKPLTLAAAMDGHAALLIFADYTCQSLCGSIMSLTTDLLAKSRLDLRRYRVVVLGLDSKDGAAAAAAMKQRQVTEDDVASVTTVLTADDATIRAVADSVGYRFVYDAERDQFVHPAAILVLAKDGRVARVLSALEIGPDQIRSALLGADRSRISSFGRAVYVLCYGFDPSVGRYTGLVYRALVTTAVLTLLAFVGGIAWMSLRTPRSR